MPSGAVRDSIAFEKQVGGRHYKKHNIQPWHIVDEYELDFYLGNVVKYVLRDKGAKINDLEKAIHYIERKIEILKENPNQVKMDFDKLNDKAKAKEAYKS